MKEIKYVPSENGECKSLETPKSDTKFLYFTILTVNLLLFGGGACFSWTSPAIPKFQSNDTAVNPLGVPITTVDISMLTGMPFLFGLGGSSFTGFIADKIGRKKLLQIFGLMMCLCNAIIAFSIHIMSVIIFRCFFFMFYGGSLTLVPIFLTEVCEDHNRAKYGCFIGFCLPLGTLLVFVIGPAFSVKIFTLLISIPLLLFIIFSFFVPESPVFSLTQGKSRECRSSLLKLRSNKSSKQIDYDVEVLQKSLHSIRGNSTNKTFLSLFKTKEVRMGLLFATIPTIIQYSSGVSVVIPLTAPIFNELGTNISGNNVAILVAIVQCTCYLGASFLIEKTGKKLLLFISTLGCFVPITILGLCFYLKHINSSVINNLSWLPVVAFLLYIIVYSIGLGPIPQALIGEMFASDIRGTAASFSMATMSIAIFLLSSAFPIVAKAAGMYYCFCIFGISCLMGAVFIYTIFPETKQKSLSELQQIMRSYKFNLKWNK